MRKKRAFANILERIGLLGPAYHLSKKLPELAPSHLKEPRQSEGLPIPPTKLRNLVGGTDVAGFLDSGKRSAASLEDVLKRNNRDLRECGAILDFGCGCGRVLRHLRDLSGRSQLYGCDYNGKLIDWCTQNLAFANFSKNELNPPTAYSEGQFDLIFCVLSSHTSSRGTSTELDAGVSKNTN